MISKKYIECEAAKEQIRAHIIIGEPKTNVGLNLAVEAIDDVPAADVVEMRHGRWLRTPTGWVYCSVCREEPPEETNARIKYCPNCGAKMDLPEPLKENEKI